MSLSARTRQILSGALCDSVAVDELSDSLSHGAAGPVSSNALGTYELGGASHPILGLAQVSSTITTPINDVAVISGLVSAVSVDPTIDDPEFNEYSALCAIAHVPATNSQLINEVYSIECVVDYEGGYNGAEVIGIVIYADATTQCGDLVGLSTVASAYQDCPRILGVYSVPRVMGGTCDFMSGLYAQVLVSATTTAVLATGLWVESPSVAGTTTTQVGVYIKDHTNVNATNSYALWYDSPGVFRIRYDGVLAYYNPGYGTKYTPGSETFERVVLQWSSNTAQLAVEKGSSAGTLRALNLVAAGVGVGANAPDASAALQVDSTTQGFLPPRMTTTQRNAISSPLEGLVIYNTTTHKLDVFNGSSWLEVTMA